jgi:hypothetical protein
MGAKMNCSINRLLVRAEGNEAGISDNGKYSSSGKTIDETVFTVNCYATH